MKLGPFLIAGIISIASLGGAHGQQKNYVKGQAQLSGANVKFGTVYSLKNKFNFVVYSAKYTLEPMQEYFGDAYPRPSEKLLIFQIGIKNASPDHNNFAATFKVVDNKQNIYDREGFQLQSEGLREWSAGLNPGQGVGQPDLNDPVRVVFRVPGDAVVDKLMISPGRLNTNEEVLRYALVPKASATNKNVISPLPPEVRDPSDPNGQIALPAGLAKMGQYYPSNVGELKAVEISSPTDAVFKGQPAPANKKFVVVKFTVMAPTLDTMNASIYTTDTYSLLDADGDKYEMWGVRKASSDEDPDRKLQKGDEFSFRMFFVVPKSVSLKELDMGFFSGRTWKVDLSGLSL